MSSPLSSIAREQAVKEIQSLCHEQCGTDEADKLEILQRHEASVPPNMVDVLDLINDMISSGADVEVHTRPQTIDITTFGSPGQVFMPVGNNVTVTIRQRRPIP